jgi:hypothetical protein
VWTWNGAVTAETDWYYLHPSLLARKIGNHVAFWNGARVDLEAGPRPPARRTPGAPAASQAGSSSGPGMPPGAAG